MDIIVRALSGGKRRRRTKSSTGRESASRPPFWRELYCKSSKGGLSRKREARRSASSRVLLPVGIGAKKVARFAIGSRESRVG